MEVFSGKNGSAILLMLPRELSAQVMEWGQKNISPDRLSGLPNKGYDKSPHITLASGITDEEPEKAFDLLEKHGPINVTLGPVECFRKHDKGYDVIKISVLSPELQKLNQSILGAVEMHDPIYSFSPHVTIAYVKPFSCDNLLGNSQFKDLEVPIDGYVYSDRAKGGRVVKLGREPLKESLDYSLQEIAEFSGGDVLSVRAMSSVDIAKRIIAKHISNKTV